MATDVSYELDDFATVKAVLTSSALSVATLQALVGTGWRGFYEANEFITPVPVPSQDAQNPTMWIRFDVAHEGEPEGCLDPDGDVTRDGTVRLQLRYEPGTLTGRVNKLFKAIRQAFSDASTESFVYFVGSPSEYRPNQAGFAVRELPIRFKGV